MKDRAKMQGDQRETGFETGAVRSTAFDYSRNIALFTAKPTAVVPREVDTYLPQHYIHHRSEKCSANIARYYVSFFRFPGFFKATNF